MAALRAFRFYRDLPFWIGCAAYAATRAGWFVPPGALRGHFADLWVIPCALPIVLAVHDWFGWRAPGPPTSTELGMHLVGWSVLFEWIGPRYLGAGVADPWDVACYALGGAGAWLWWRRPAASRDGRYNAVAHCPGRRAMTLHRPLAVLFAVVAAAPLLAQAPTPPRPASVNTQPRRDVSAMPRPIDLHDSVWIEDLTMLEVRDLLKAGKTTALVLTGGIEENGPYLTTGKHNNVLKAQGESIARALGNALVAPIVTLEPGQPTRPNLSPGTIVLSQATYRAVLTDIATSLRTQGFTDIVMMGDSGGNLKGMQEVASTLNAEWKGQGRVHFIPEYYNYGDVEHFQETELGIHETLEGFHDDYYISAIIATVDTDAIRMPERRKAGKFVINGVPLDPIEKTIANGLRMVQFRTDAAVAAIKRSMAAAGVSR